MARLDDTPIGQSTMSKTWADAVKKAGLPAGTRHHDLRHTFASALISAGCSVKVVQKALGHKSAVMTLDVYASLWPDDEDRTRGAVEAFLGAVSSACHEVPTPAQNPRSEATIAQLP